MGCIQKANKLDLVHGLQSANLCCKAVVFNPDYIVQPESLKMIQMNENLILICVKLSKYSKVKPAMIGFGLEPIY